MQQLCLFISVSMWVLFLFSGEGYVLYGLLVISAFLLTGSAVAWRSVIKRRKAMGQADNASRLTIIEYLNENSAQVSSVIEGIRDTYANTVHSLGLQDLKGLKQNKKSLHQLRMELDQLQEGVSYIQRSLDQRGVTTTGLKMSIPMLLQEMIHLAGNISKSSYEHIKKHRRNLRFNQIRDLRRIDGRFCELLDRVRMVFDDLSFDQAHDIAEDLLEVSKVVSGLIEKQCARNRIGETQPESTELYLSLLKETELLIKSNIRLLRIFSELDTR